MMKMIHGTFEILTSIIAICKSECNPRKNCHNMWEQRWMKFLNEHIKETWTFYNENDPE